MKPIVLCVAMLLLGSGSAFASCAELSYERNAIFKRAGYCFKTAEIERFGNAGCQFDNQADVPLSQRDRVTIADILRQERIEGCR